MLCCIAYSLTNDLSNADGKFLLTFPWRDGQNLYTPFTNAGGFNDKVLN